MVRLRYGSGRKLRSLFFRRLWRYGELSKAVNLARLVDDISHCKMLEIARSKYPPGVRFDVTPELIHEHLLEPTYAGVVYSVFECMAELQHRKRVGNKNPSYWAHLDLLAQLFPSQAKYLCIVRDGRDVALSRMKLKWGRTSVFACARTWVESLRAVEDFQKTLAGGRLLVIRYEDLLATPESVVSQMESFLAAPLDSERRGALVGSIEQSKTRGNFDKWRQEMTARDLEIYEAVAGRWLEKYGYERGIDAPRIGWYVAPWYSTMELWRRVWLNVDVLARRLFVSVRSLGGRA